MKRILLLIAIFTLSLNYVSAQKVYYWSAGKKNYLDKMDNRYIVKLDKNKDVKALEEKLISEKQITGLVKIKNQIGIVVAEEGIQKDVNFLNSISAYRLGNLPVYFTGEILLKPQKNISINTILEFIAHQATINNKPSTILMY